nr:MAG TPA: hypothetical protein [Caudoviricetes sp.]
MFAVPLVSLTNLLAMCLIFMLQIYKIYLNLPIFFLLFFSSFKKECVFMVE